LFWFAILNIDFSKLNLQMFLVVGIMLALAYFGTIIFEKYNLPRVISYIIIGFILGQSILGLVTTDIINQLDFISFFALSLIGFTVGGELVYSRIKELGSSIPIITIMESLGAFILVFTGVYLVTKSVPAGLLLGALASATAPAATVGVLWQYHAKGPLTTTLYAVVGLDDAAALIIYAFASAFAIAMLAHSGGGSLAVIVGKPMMEIIGAVMLGALFGVVLHFIGLKSERKDNLLLITIGAILMCAGIAESLGYSLILTNMVLGVTLVNISDRNDKYFNIIHDFNPPFYCLFLILVGARLDYRLIPHVGLVGVVYIIARMAGKSLGAWIGAVVSRAKTVVRKYLGFGLFSAAGVPIGLAIEMSHRVKQLGSPEASHLSVVIFTVLIATLFIFEVVGPLLAKRAVIKAGEVDQKYLK